MHGVARCYESSASLIDVGGENSPGLGRIRPCSMSVKARQRVRQSSVPEPVLALAAAMVSLAVAPGRPWRRTRPVYRSTEGFLRSAATGAETLRRPSSRRWPSGSRLARSFPARSASRIRQAAVLRRPDRDLEVAGCGIARYRLGAGAAPTSRARPSSTRRNPPETPPSPTIWVDRPDRPTSATGAPTRRSASRPRRSCKRCKRGWKKWKWRRDGSPAPFSRPPVVHSTSGSTSERWTTVSTA